MKKLPGILILILAVHVSLGCTTAIISGKYTNDGRPIIWKLRDTDFLENKMMFFDDDKYDYVGLVNSEDVSGKQVWGGANAVGFAIMNSASFNVNMNDTVSEKDQEGVIMKKALQTCASLGEFEQLLNNLPKPMGLAAHFGVIDANGGAAFYEVNNQTFTKFDANDAAEAPNGYIIRTNFSFTGKKDVGYGFIRFQTAQEIFYQADAMGKLNHKTVIQEFSRCFKHPVLGKDFRKEYENIPAGEHFINSGDFITRHGSSSNIVIQGVKKGQPADMATIWTNVGFPNTCITVPAWVRGGQNLPAVLRAGASGNAPLNAASLELKKKCYPIKRSSGYKYLQISALINSEKTGIVQKLEAAEKVIFSETEKNTNKWLQNSPKKNEIVEFYNWLDDYVIKTYANQFGIEIKLNR